MSGEIESANEISAIESVLEDSSFWAEVLRHELSFALFGLVVGWLLSLVLAHMNERWAIAREERNHARQLSKARAERLRGQLTDLVRSYQFYVRLLRSKSEAISQLDLDHAHAEFFASAKMFKLEPGFEESFERLKKVSDVMSNMKTVKPENLSNKMNHIYVEFDKSLNDLSEAVERIEHKN